MRLLSLLLLAILLLTSQATAADRQVWHYLGEVKINSATGQPMPSRSVVSGLSRAGVIFN